MGTERLREMKDKGSVQVNFEAKPKYIRCLFDEYFCESEIEEYAASLGYKVKNIETDESNTGTWKAIVKPIKKKSKAEAKFFRLFQKIIEIQPYISLEMGYKKETGYMIRLFYDRGAATENTNTVVAVQTGDKEELFKEVDRFSELDIALFRNEGKDELFKVAVSELDYVLTNLKAASCYYG